MKSIHIGKLIILFVASFMISVTNVYAGCLNEVATSQIITSKIRGFFVNPANSTQYVIIDKATCSASSGTTTISNSTKDDYYLAYKDADKSLISALYVAYSKGDLVDFRIGGSLIGGYNNVAYAIVPSGARSQ